jgi:GntR family transcriptional regulator
LHTQISDQIHAAICGGTLHPGDQLLPEAELAQQAHVARRTVRHALDNLQRERMIERRHGIRTFVAEQAAREERLRRRPSATPMRQASPRRR